MGNETHKNKEVIRKDNVEHKYLYSTAFHIAVKLLRIIFQTVGTDLNPFKSDFFKGLHLLSSPSFVWRGFSPSAVEIKMPDDDPMMSVFPFPRPQLFDCPLPPSSRHDTFGRQEIRIRRKISPGGLFFSSSSDTMGPTCVCGGGREGRGEKKSLDTLYTFPFPIFPCGPVRGIAKRSESLVKIFIRRCGLMVNVKRCLEILFNVFLICLVKYTLCPDLSCIFVAILPADV